MDNLPPPQINNAPPPPSEPKDWEISKLYEKSWEIVKKNKILWLFGMALTAGGLGSGGGGGNSGSSFESKDFEKIFQTPGGESAPNQISQVLGTSTDVWGQLWNQIIQTVPLSFVVILVLELFILIIGAIVIGLVYKAWANGSLIQSIQTDLDGGKATIRESSEKAFRTIKPLIWLTVVPCLIFVLLSMLVFTILTVGIIAGGTLLKVIFGILMVVAVIGFIYGVLMLIGSEIWATRKIVLDRIPAWQSFKSGFAITRRKFWSMLLLGLVNNILAVLIVVIPLGLIIALVAGGIFGMDLNTGLGIGLIAVGIILLIAFIIAMQVVGGIITAFKASVWTIAYNQIKGKYDGKS